MQLQILRLLPMLPGGQYEHELITGRNHHSAATGVITDAATGYEGYTCVLPRSCGTTGEVLRQNGYSTAWIGKNHNTPAWETSAVGLFDRWANGLGFDYF